MQKREHFSLFYLASLRSKNTVKMLEGIFEIMRFDHHRQEVGLPYFLPI